MYFIENAVSVNDIAAELKQKPAEVEAEARVLGMGVGADWRGRPALSTADAQALVSGSARLTADHAAEQRALAEQAEAWVAERARVVQDARRKVLGGKLITPSLRVKAVEASSEAGRQFERKCPAAIRPRVSFVYEGAAA